MPRRYRPPARRRKGKRPPARGLQALHRPEGEAATSRPSSSPMAVPTLVREARPEVKHVARDYSYVLSELRIIVLLALFLLASLVLTALFLRWI